MKVFIIYMIIGMVIIVAQEIIVDSALYGIRNFKTVFRHSRNVFKTEMWKLNTIEKVISYTVLALFILAWPIMVICTIIRDIRIIKSGRLITLEQILSEEQDES